MNGHLRSGRCRHVMNFVCTCQDDRTCNIIRIAKVTKIVVIEL